MATVKTLLRKGIQRLQSITKYPQRESEELLLKAMGIANLELITPFTYSRNHAQLLTRDAVKQYDHFLERRSNKEPLEYITGIAEFYGHKFIVDQSVLIPRQDTETLVTKISDSMARMNSEKIEMIDLGCGSGCVFISLLLCFPNNLHATAVDISTKALNISKHNATLYNVAHKVNFVESSWFSNVPVENPFDIIVSNPPYIQLSDISLLDESVRCFEPSIALHGGEDGLECYRDISRQLSRYIHKRNSGKSTVAFEVGSLHKQAEQVVEIFLLNRELNVSNVEIHRDCENRNRVVMFDAISSIT